MSSIATLKKKLTQLEAEKSAILTKVSNAARTNANARKYAIGGALLKLATTDPAAHRVLKSVCEMAQEDRPRAFEDFNLPEAPTAPPKQRAAPEVPPPQSH